MPAERVSQGENNSSSVCFPKERMMCQSGIIVKDLMVMAPLQYAAIVSIHRGSTK